MRRALLAGIAAMTLLGGCSKDAEPADEAQASAAAPAEPAPPPPPPPPAEPVKVSEESALYQFDYAYPAEAAGLPALKALLDADLADSRSKVATEAREGREDARANDYPFNPFFASREWQVVADLPGWLSLSAMVSEFSGGAHPNHWPDALLWDKAANRRVKALDMFTSKEALSSAIRPSFCRQIDARRRKNRSEGPPPAGDDPFWECLDPVDYTIILGSSDKQHFDRIGILVPPYEAGPYAEGDYEATVAVTSAVLKAVKPQYRAAFAIGR